MTMMQNQIGLVEFADLECRASEVPQGTLHCTGRICKTTPRHPENIVKPFHLFWGADLVAKQQDPSLAQTWYCSFQVNSSLCPSWEEFEQKKLDVKAVLRSKSQIFTVRKGFTPVCVCRTFLKILWHQRSWSLQDSSREHSSGYIVSRVT